MKIMITVKVLICLLFCFTVAAAQDFRSDWNAFNDKNWELSFRQDSSERLETRTEGRLIFTSKKDTLKTFVYWVFSAKVANAAFEKKVQVWQQMQSCVYFDIPAASFRYGNYYYLSGPCQQCPAALKEDCADLRKKLGAH